MATTRSFFILILALNSITLEGRCQLTIEVLKDSIQVNKDNTFTVPFRLTCSDSSIVIPAFKDEIKGPKFEGLSLPLILIPSTRGVGSSNTPAELDQEQVDKLGNKRSKPLITRKRFKKRSIPVYPYYITSSSDTLEVSFDLKNYPEIKSRQSSQLKIRFATLMFEGARSYVPDLAKRNFLVYQFQHSETESLFYTEAVNSNTFTLIAK